MSRCQFISSNSLVLQHHLKSHQAVLKMFKQLLLLSLLGLALAAPSTKVEPSLAKSLRSKSLVNVFVKFGSGNQDIIRGMHTLRFNTRAEKTTHMVASLKAFSESNQRNAVALLQSSRFAYSAVTFKQFWVSNELYVKGASAQLISQLEVLPEVFEIREERVISIEKLSGDIQPQAQWNLEKVEAPNAWQLPGGNNGQGVVVANIDTGVRHTHEAISGNYRADYGWFDPYTGSNEPIDDNGHGTHTMGTLAGAGVGVAPGAQWIACQGCNFIFCSESALKGCGEWALCPTRPDGSDPDCSKAPKVVSNSWGGSGNDDFYNDITEAWKAAGIIPVFAIGNSGPSCSTAGSPGDQSVIAVGSTTQEDTISGSSSAGPGPSGVIKPDLSAPGQLIYSAWNTADDAYSTISGTSMACPHVAGAVTLLLSRNPNLTYDQVKDLLEKNVDTEGLGDTGRVCGGVNSTTFPNYQYGHGRLNARKALEAAIRSF